MPIQIVEESVTATSLARHGEIPAALQVERVLELTLVEDGLGGVELTETPVESPWVKNYDDREPPADWVERFDVSNWILLTAYDSEERVGGAVIALDTPEVHILEGRQDLAVLWDIRVAPETRGSGVGESLFRAAETSCRSRGCHTLKVETQNINVPACRFYQRMGCTLGTVNRFSTPAQTFPRCPYPKGRRLAQNEAVIEWSCAGVWCRGGAIRPDSLQDLSCFRDTSS